MSTRVADDIVTPGTSASLPRKSFGACLITDHGERSSTITTSSFPSSTRAAGAMSAPLPYCRPLAIATSSTCDRRSSPSTVIAYSCFVRAKISLLGNFEIATEAAAYETGCGELVRDARVESDAGEIEEEPALDLARIDHAFVAAERDLECRMRIERNAEFTREPVAGSTRDDPQ